MSTALSDHSLLHCGLAVWSTTARTSFLGLCPAASSWELFTRGSLCLSTCLNCTNPSDVDAQTGTHRAHPERGLQIETWLPTLRQGHSQGREGILVKFETSERGHPRWITGYSVGCENLCGCLCQTMVLLRLELCPILLFIHWKKSYFLSPFCWCGKLHWYFKYWIKLVFLRWSLVSLDVLSFSYIVGLHLPVFHSEFKNKFSYYLKYISY